MSDVVEALAAQVPEDSPEEWFLSWSTGFRQLAWFFRNWHGSFM
jgi:hypothetical protein